MDLDLQLMNALVVANQGLPKIKGCPSRRVLGCSTRKSAGYSQESTDKMVSSRTPYRRILDQSMSFNTMGVGLMLVSPNNSAVSLVMMFISTPISLRVLGMIIFPIWMVILGFQGSSYLTSVVFPIMSSDNFFNT
jgi:hypothetical protein